MAQGTRALFPDLETDSASRHKTGILPSQEVEALVRAGHIMAEPAIADDQIQPASIDLRLGAVAYRVRSSFLAGEASTVRDKIETLAMHEIDLAGGAVLEKGCVYIAPLVEELRLPAQVAGRANPKSSTGRLDIFTRVMTDYSKEFEIITKGYKGKLFVEISPRTFSVLVRAGARLNQLRFIRGSPLPSDKELSRLHDRETLVYSEDESPEKATISRGLWISIDLKENHKSGLIGYRAKKHAPVIDLDQAGFYEPLDFWEPITKIDAKGIILNPGDFYILGSKEKIRIPPTYAAEMVAYDTSLGEFRIHYAGFFDPGFGYGSDDIPGTRVTLEVRSHEVPFLLEDGQKVGRLIYQRLTQRPSKIYGSAIGSSYQRQDLALSKQFKAVGEP